MKNLLLLLLLLLPGMSRAQSQYPNQHTFVTDFANVIPDSVQAVLEQRLVNYEKQTSVEVAFVTVPTLGDNEIDGFTNELFRQWGVGKKGVNSGVMVVMAIAEKKFRIEVGYGIEPFVTDAHSFRIAKACMIPYLKKQDYAGAVQATSEALIKQIGPNSAELRAEYLKAHPQEHVNIWVIIIVTIIIILIIIWLLRNVGSDGYSSGGSYDSDYSSSSSSSSSSWDFGGGDSGGGGFSSSWDD